VVGGVVVVGGPVGVDATVAGELVDVVVVAERSASRRVHAPMASSIEASRQGTVGGRMVI
jgi:hypothetical protein